MTFCLQQRDRQQSKVAIAILNKDVAMLRLYIVCGSISNFYD
ncbi:hypothetical protein [Rivularia sp. UHCC 0363]|nr:hypothetical protein [Rivularia sp. UHCC 0363]MEA5594934.1 hypothetical protein [Rivularia sp. UHCC 0363]